jgi:hypothetical protein
LSSHPDAMEKAKTKIMQMIENFKQVMTRIDEEMIRAWVKDLVIVKTFALRAVIQTFAVRVPTMIVRLAVSMLSRSVCV